MAKSKPSTKPSTKPSSPVTNNCSSQYAVDSGRGTIRDNYLAALVTSKVYRMQVVNAKKGKGSFKRQDKHANQGQEPYLIAA